MVSKCAITQLVNGIYEDYNLLTNLLLTCCEMINIYIYIHIICTP